MVRYEKVCDMVPTAAREDPLMQYLLGFALVTLVVGSVGAVAQTIHTNELPSLVYTATILGLAALFAAMAGVYHRTLYTPNSVAVADEKRERTKTTEEEEVAGENESRPDEESTPESQTAEGTSAKSE